MVQAEVLCTRDGEKKRSVPANPPLLGSIPQIHHLIDPLDMLVFFLTCGTVYRAVGALLVVLVVQGGIQFVQLVPVLFSLFTCGEADRS